jgi:hypothetical protein
MMWKTAVHTDAVELDGEWIVLDAEQYVVTRLNETGGFLWNLIKKGATVNMLTEALVEEYGIPREMAKHDAENFIARLQELGLIVHAA